MAYLIQEETWLQRHSRTILAALSGLGVLLTTYLTLNKLTGQTAAFCTGDGGCDLVLNSRWSWFLGIPTAAWGLMGFLVVFALALLPDTLPFVKKWRWPGLFALVCGMVAFEFYMGYLMAVKLQQACLYCITAMVLVAGIAIVTFFGRRWQDWGMMGFSGILIAAFTLVATAGVYANQVPPSSPFAVGLANHLQEIDGRMYGAYWCPHCAEQKELFGPVFKDVPYVECSPNGRGTPPAQECLDAGIQSYPTWIIDGERHRGRRSLEELAQISGYEPGES